MPEEKEVEEPFENKFVFLDKDYAKKMMFSYHKPAVFSEKFQEMLDKFDALRVEIGYDRMTPEEGFVQAVEIEKDYNFGSHLNFSDGKIDAKYYYDAVLTEMRGLSLTFPETAGSDEHRWSYDTSGMYRDAYRARTSLSLKPIKPVSLDFDVAVDAAVQNVVSALDKASGTTGMFTDAVNDSKALREAIEGVANEAAPKLEEVHKYWDCKAA